MFVFNQTSIGHFSLIHIFFHKSDICYVQSSTGFMLLYITNELFCNELVNTRVTLPVTCRLCEATFCYENRSVLIGKNYFKKLGALGALGSVYFIPGRRTIFVKTLKTSSYRQIEIIALQTTSSNFMLMQKINKCPAKDKQMPSNVVFVGKKT